MRSRLKRAADHAQGRGSKGIELQDIIDSQSYASSDGMNIAALSDPERLLGKPIPTLLILGRPTCDDCQAYYARLKTWTPPRELEVLTLNLRGV